MQGLQNKLTDAITPLENSQRAGGVTNRNIKRRVGARFFTAAWNIKVLRRKQKLSCSLLVGYPACRFKWHRRAHNLNVNYTKVPSLSLHQRNFSLVRESGDEMIK